MFPAHVFMCQKVAGKKKFNTSKWVSLLVDLNLRIASRQQNCTSYYQSERTREVLDGIQNHTKTHFAHLLAPAQPQLPKFHILLEKSNTSNNLINYEQWRKILEH
jgi:hypothetical protein